MDPVLSLIIVILLSYLLGGIPSGVIVSKTFCGFDIREKGSGNMGSTNAFRVLGVKWGSVVQVADLLKGLLAVLLIAQLFNTDNLFSSDIAENSMIVQIIAGISAVLGHIFSIYVKFKGGKGISTAGGMLFGVAPVDATIAIILFIIIIILTGYVSIGSMTAAITIPVSVLIRHLFFGHEVPGFNVLIYFLMALAVMLILAHISNIKRLINGTENRFDKIRIFKKQDKEK
jgi:glycerol-3-phosphate acyltransferase PlsY